MNRIIMLIINLNTNNNIKNMFDDYIFFLLNYLLTLFDICYNSLEENKELKSLDGSFLQNVIIMFNKCKQDYKENYIFPVLFHLTKNYIVPKYDHFSNNIYNIII
jgi:hypothetical protein